MSALGPRGLWHEAQQLDSKLAPNVLLGRSEVPAFSAPPSSFVSVNCLQKDTMLEEGDEETDEKPYLEVCLFGKEMLALVIKKREKCPFKKQFAPTSTLADIRPYLRRELYRFPFCLSFPFSSLIFALKYSSSEKVFTVSRVPYRSFTKFL